jgi:hypothetical protein
LKTFLTQIGSTVPLTPDPPVICFWKWIHGERTMEYQKIAIWRAFLQKRIFSHPTAHTRLLVPAGPLALRAPTRTVLQALPTHPHCAPQAPPHNLAAGSRTCHRPMTQPQPHYQRHPPRHCRRPTSPPPALTSDPGAAHTRDVLHDAARRHHRAKLGREVTEKKKATHGKDGENGETVGSITPNSTRRSRPLLDPREAGQEESEELCKRAGACSCAPPPNITVSLLLACLRRGGGPPRGEICA